MAPSEQVACQESPLSYLLKWAFFRSLAADQIRALHVLCKDFPIIRSKTSICQLLRNLTSNVPGVQAASNCRVGRAFDDGTAIGKEGHFVGIVPELQHEVIVPDHAVGLEAAIHLREIDWPLVLVNLHGVATAERNMRSPFSREMDKVFCSARTTVGTRLSR